MSNWIEDYDLPPLSKKAVRKIHRRITQGLHTTQEAPKNRYSVLLTPLKWLEYIDLFGVLTDEIKNELAPYILGADENVEE